MHLDFRAVVFDMDGTLFGTERIAIDTLQAVFRECGVEVGAAALETIIGRAGQETRIYLSQFLPAGTGIDELLERWWERIEAHIDREGMPIKPGASELLPHLFRQGIALGLATTSRTASALANLRRAGLDGYFRAVVGCDQVENHKPHPEIYLKALAALAVEAALAIAVEDSDLGIQAARAAGLRVIHVPDVKRLDAATRALVHREYPVVCRNSIASVSAVTRAGLKLPRGSRSRELRQADRGGPPSRCRP